MKTHLLFMVLLFSCCFKIKTQNNFLNSNLKQNSSFTIHTWKAFSNSMNVDGLLNSNTKVLSYDENLDVVSFLQRKACTYSITNTPEDNNGVIVAFIGYNWNPIANNFICSPTFDSSAIASSANNLPYAVQGGIYNPPGNTNINNSYIVGCGPTKNSANNYTGNWFSSKQLGLVNYNNTPNTSPNAQQWFGNPATASLLGHNLNYNNFSITDDGKLRSIGKVGTSFTGSLQTNPGDTSIYITTGSFSVGTFNWVGTELYPDFKRSTTNKSHIENYLMAWNETGTVGYAIAIGQNKTTTVSVNQGLQPKVWKTINSGASWAQILDIDFSLPTFSTIINDLPATLKTNTNVAVPWFYAGEGQDAVVDKNDELHLITTILPHAYIISDSITVKNHFYNFSDYYYWPHTPGKRPYVYDFKTNGSNWSFTKIDSLSTEAPRATIEEQDAGHGYDENPWIANSAGKKTVSSSRIQAGRTVDGSLIYYSWAESDTLITNGNKKWNTFPNIKLRFLNVNANTLSAEYNITAPTGSIGLNTKVKNYAYFHCSSPKTNSVFGNLSSNYTLSIPFTVSNNQSLDGYGDCVDLSKSITHYFNAATIINSNPYPIYSCVVPNPCTINSLKENSTTNYLNFNMLPNPSNGNTQLNFYSLTNTFTQINVTDVSGKIIKSILVDSYAGENKINLNLNEVRSGLYFVSLILNNQKTTQKLIIE